MVLVHLTDALDSEKLVRRVKHGRLHKQHLSPQLLEAAVEVGPGTDQRHWLPEGIERHLQSVRQPRTTTSRPALLATLRSKAFARLRQISQATRSFKMLTSNMSHFARTPAVNFRFPPLPSLTFA